ncbi:hypothetical protein [uncultured Martelella sp.]|uniref:DUF4376 domain-containing protein n=1 Tax=uncultured Martelella sp. TaxID=392331 RepID=UPI0029C6A8FC|nr:hypothetical protein [uncultured Martelella sp.]
MEKGYYHPSRGYWQTTSAPSERIKFNYPDGTVEVPVKPGEDFALIDGAWVAASPALHVLQARKTAAINNRLNARLADGYRYAADQHVALDQSSRADMSAMAATALAVTSGSANWPDSYKTGWITVENSRIQLETPDDGLALAAAVGDHYAALRQHARDLKDAVLAAGDETALEAIDTEAGWPGGDAL